MFSAALATRLPFLLPAQLDLTFLEVALYRSFVIFATLAVVMHAVTTPIASAAQQSPDSAIFPASPEIKDDLLSLPLSSRSELVPLLPAAVAPNCSVQIPASANCDGEQLRMGKVQAERTERLRKTLLHLQKDKRHGVHIYFLDRSQKKGRVLSVDEDSFVLKVAKDQPEITIFYKDVVEVSKEQTGPEKFNDNVWAGVDLTIELGMVVFLAPLWLPFALFHPH
jgi:hypothetical protein